MNRNISKHINTLFIVAPMSFIMATVSILRNYGLKAGWVPKLFNSWLVMLPVAYIAAFIIIPPARRLAEKVASRF